MVALGILLGATVAFAQPSAPAPATPVSAPNPPTASGSTVVLSPFEVQTSQDKGYSALNSNSITGFNASLDKLPLSAQVFDEKFMQDVGATDVEDMIRDYSAGAGYSGADPGGSAATQQPGDRNGNAYITLRGFATPVMVRDSFMTVGSIGNPGSTGVGVTEDFDIERVEIIDGPQALLYGNGGGAGGVINVISKQARLGAPTFGSDRFMIDQYGTKMNTLDYGTGNDRFAVRVALLNGTQDYNRLDVGGDMSGYYGQVAVSLPFKTILRITTEGTTYNRINSDSPSLTAPTGTSGDPRNGTPLVYLLATGRAGAIDPDNGQPYVDGAIDNGNLNWGNVYSFEGWQAAELTTNQFSTAVLETDWSSWLSTQVQVGFDDYRDDRVNAGFNFNAPTVAGNPTGTWAGEISPEDTTEPVYTKAIRVAALLTNDLFGGRAHSQTNFGADETSSTQGEFQYTYYEADSNWNLLGGGTAANNGRIPQPKLYWSIANGPVLYALPSAETKYYTWGGVNYVRQLSNPVNPTLKSANDPLGVILGGSNYSINESNNRGVFAVNYTSWLDGRLDTLIGGRLGKFYFADQNQGSAPTASSPNSHAYRVSSSNTPSFNVGADYTILPWLHPYVSASDSYDAPVSESADPYGNLPKTAHGTGEEVGLKLNNAGSTISGEIAFYHTQSQNEQLTLSSTIENDVNPAGLNGRWNSPNQWININREAQGMEITLTAEPTPQWRVFFNAATIDGKIGSTVQFGQLYNDQFFENPAGDLTYSDGTPVYVLSNATSSTAKEVAPTAAGATPLTVAMMDNANSPFYANPAVVSGAINSGSAVAKIMENPLYTSTHGAILTGVSGLPISDIQINPGFTPPGNIVAAASGDETTGYPEFSINCTNVYAFDHGPLKGLELGTSVRSYWKYKYYYFYASGVTPTGSGRTLFYLPSRTELDPILAYSRKVGRFEFRTQLNIYNLFNHYDVILLPNENTGFGATSTSATFSGEPRFYQWTNTISF